MISWKQFTGALDDGVFAESMFGKLRRAGRTADRVVKWRRAYRELKEVVETHPREDEPYMAPPPAFPGEE